MSQDKRQLCIEEMEKVLRRDAAEGSLYAEGLYDAQVAQGSCCGGNGIEGFGCVGSKKTINKFLLILLVVAIVAYFVSSSRVRIYDLGIGSVASTTPQVMEVRRMLR